MADCLNIDYSEMADAARKLNVEWDTMSGCIQKITDVVNSIPEFWQAETATKYMQQYEELQPGLTDAVELIADLAKQMEDISTNFQETDTGMAGQI